MKKIRVTEIHEDDAHSDPGYIGMKLWIDPSHIQIWEDAEYKGWSYGPAYVYEDKSDIVYFHFLAFKYVEI